MHLHLATGTYGLEPCNGQRLTPFANALDLSIDDLIFGPYFGVPRQRGTPAHRAVNSTAALSARSIKGGACRLRLR